MPRARARQFFSSGLGFGLATQKPGLGLGLGLGLETCWTRTRTRVLRIWTRTRTRTRLETCGLGLDSDSRKRGLVASLENMQCLRRDGNFIGTENERSVVIRWLFQAWFTPCCLVVGKMLTYS